MRNREMSDAALVEDCAEFLDLLASYVEGCNVLEEAEANSVEGQDIEESQRRIVAVRRQWRAMLRRIGSSPAYTDKGILAKNAAMHGYFAEYPAEDIEIMGLLGSFFRDIKQRFGGSS